MPLKAKHLAQLAEQLGGLHARFRSPAADVVVAERPRVRCSLVRALAKDGQTELYSIQGQVHSGRDARRVRRALAEDPELSAAIAELAPQHVEPQLEQGAVQNAALVLVVPHRTFERAATRLARVRRVVEALARLLAEDAAPRTDACVRCARPDVPPLGEEVGPDLFGVRLCADCREVGERLELLGASDPTSPQGLSLIDVDPRPYEERRSGLRAAFERDPAAYRRMLSRWARIGQAALLSAVVATGGLTVLVVGGLIAAGVLLEGGLLLLLTKAGKLVVVALIAAALGAWSLVRSLLPPRLEPEGLELAPDELPGFRRWLAELAAHVGAPPVERILLSTSVNASVGLLPRGWLRAERTLTLGLPLIELFSRDELTAVLAHELGHLRHEDHLEARLYRTACAWSQLAGRLDQEGTLLRRIALWYVPEFFLRSEVLSRAQELRADREAARITSPELMGRALVKTALVASLFGEALGKVLGGDPAQRAPGRAACATEAADPAAGLVALWRAALDALPCERRERALREVLEEKSHWLDSHPRLAERLAALGVAPPEQAEWELAPAEPASALLDDYPALRQRVLATDVLRFQAWSQAAVRLRAWAASHLARLEAEGEASTPEGEANRRVCLARLRHRLADEPAAEREYALALARDPDHLDARVELAALRAEREDWAGASEAIAPALELPEEELGIEHLMVVVQIGETGQTPALARAGLRRLLAKEPPAAIRSELEDRLARLPAEGAEAA